MWENWRQVRVGRGEKRESGECEENGGKKRKKKYKIK